MDPNEARPQIQNQPPAKAAAGHFRTALIVDDHPLFCDALSMTLKSVAGIARIDTAESLDAAMEHIAQNGPPEIIVLDLNLPDVTGLDGLMRLKAVAGNVPIVVVSSMSESRMVCSTIHAGAAGFVPKHSQRPVFRAAFETIGAGEVFLPEGVVLTKTPEQPVNDQSEAVERLALLTRQQSRILLLICEGRLNKQIAYELSIAETTVKTHVTAIMRKLGVQTRTQAVLIAQMASFSNVLRETD
ncbi:two component transcriptional regulator, LuxR family [Roseovarius lutimaris]|uniref:Two component transcriptional regulator, LuxR family n=1 Tax=Roseovarius lutimaris TaxID=1005928 RepID=A0A1I5GAM3_9RHOB|nr:response regulator transcription factor [Roseovarius lutimaris]SFO32977.1 two component transcriptional regulator, LuxR family [Roseovarius lutimaris]